MDRLQDLIDEIKKLEKELLIELQKKEQAFSYKIQGKKVYFEEEIKKYHKTLAMGWHRYIFKARLLNILTLPIIWLCLFPALLMDLVVSVYQFICFPVYGIPKVIRGRYIVIDRQNLNYLNTFEKINCIYCGYFNGLIAYVQEIAARTEQYWCPIKHARRLDTIHNRYHKFVEFGDHHDYHKRVKNIRRDFKDLEDE